MAKILVEAIIICFQRFEGCKVAGQWGASRCAWIWAKDEVSVIDRCDTHPELAWLRTKVVVNIPKRLSRKAEFLYCPAFDGALIPNPECAIIAAGHNLIFRDCLKPCHSSFMFLARVNERRWFEIKSFKRAVIWAWVKNVIILPEMGVPCFELVYLRKVMCPLLSLSIEPHYRAVLITSSNSLYCRVMHQADVDHSRLFSLVQLKISCFDPSISSVNFNHVYASITSCDAPFGISLILDAQNAIGQLMGWPSHLDVIFIYTHFLERPSLRLCILI